MPTDEEIRERCGQHFKWLTNDENTEIETDEGVANQGMTNIRFAKNSRYVKLLGNDMWKGSRDE